jgi:hypothetical protein
MPNLKTAATHGVNVLDLIEKALGLSLRRATETERRSRIFALSGDALEGLVDSVIAVHRNSALPLSKMRESSSGDYCVVDASHQPTPMDQFKNLLLYSEGVLVPDPLLSHPLAVRRIVPDHFHAQFPYSLDDLRSALLDTVAFYAEYQYAIRNGLVIPTSWNVLAAMPSEVANNFVGEGALKGGFAQKVPNSLAEIAKKSARVHHSDFDGRRSVIHPGIKAREGLTSQIAIEFEGDPGSAIQFETYFSVKERNDEERTVLLEQSSPRTKEEFERWREESILKAMYNRLVVAETDLLNSSALGIALATNSKITWEIANHLTKERGGNPASIPEAVMTELKLPSLENLSLNQLVKIRSDSEALAVFRKGLRDACRAIKSTPGSLDFKKDVKAIRRDFVESGIDKLRRQYRVLRVKSASDIAMSTLAIVVSISGIAAGELAWVPGMLGALNQLKAFRDTALNESELKKEPLYMLWNAQRKPFREG